ncbi:MAG: MmcQ/YjbR family DNA-binding protein [Gammaproteobacteria bacterium]|nr:MmcQ/YjbR family DNA-binding protein [Gammaproteobacteria bacterium]
MTYEQARQYLMDLPDALLDYPFGAEVAVFKVRNKIFATLTETNGKVFSNLKCDPEEAIMLRDLFDEVMPGYHMNKKHWNTLELAGNLPRIEIQRMMENSYTLVVKNLPKKARQSLEIEYGADNIYR